MEKRYSEKWTPTIVELSNVKPILVNTIEKKQTNFFNCIIILSIQHEVYFGNLILKAVHFSNKSTKDHP